MTTVKRRERDKQSVEKFKDSSIAWRRESILICKRWSLSRVQLFVIPWTVALCPWNSPGKNTGVRSHSLLLRIFETEGWNPGLLHDRQIHHHLSNPGSPLNDIHEMKPQMEYIIATKRYCYIQVKE